VAAPAMRCVAAKHSIVRTHCAPGQMGFFMKLLAWMARHGEAVALDQAAKPASSVRRGAGTKEDVGRKRRPNRLDRRETQRDGTWDRRSKEVDRGRPVMAERKADLTIVVRLDRRRVAA